MDNESQQIVCPEFKFGVEHGLELHEELGHIVIERGKFKLDMYESHDANAAIIYTIEGEAEYRYGLTGIRGGHFVLRHGAGYMPAGNFVNKTRKWVRFTLNDTMHKVDTTSVTLIGEHELTEMLAKTPSTSQNVSVLRATTNALSIQGFSLEVETTLLRVVFTSVVFECYDRLVEIPHKNRHGVAVPALNFEHGHWSLRLYRYAEESRANI